MTDQPVTINKIVDTIENYLTNLPSPVFTNSTEHRVAKALCSYVLGEETCTTGKNKMANAAMTLFRAIAPPTQPPTVDAVNGWKTDNFMIENHAYTVLCNGGMCTLQEQVPPPEESMGQILVGALVTIMTLGFSNCGGTSSEPKTTTRDIMQFSDVTDVGEDLSAATVESAITFCAKSGYNYPNYACPTSLDCHLKPALAPIRSTCVFVDAVVQDNPASPGEDAQTNTVSYDTLWSLVSKQSIDPFSLRLHGNNVWPNKAFNTWLPVHAEGKLFRLGEIGNMIIDPGRKTIQLWLAQTQDSLCWAVYEAPCGETAVNTCE